MSKQSRPHEEHGADPVTGLTEEQARQHAADVTRRTDRIRSARGPRPPLAPVGVVVLGGLALWMTVAIVRLYPNEVVTPTRIDGTIAMLLALVAIRVAAARRPTPFSAMAGLALGVALLLLGLFGSETDTVAAIRVVNGILACTGAVLCLVSPVKQADA